MISGVAVLYTQRAELKKLWAKYFQPAQTDDSTGSETPPPTFVETNDATRTEIPDGADGESVKGYALPESMDAIKFPLSVVVKPGFSLNLGIEGGSQFDVSKGVSSGYVVYSGKINGVKSDYKILYSELKQKALAVNKNIT